MALALFFREPVRYAAGLRMQEALHAARCADAIPDVVLFLQHHPVITLGRRGRTAHLLAREEELRARGIDLVTASRGGDVTFHGPGQVVMYPIMRLGRKGDGSHGYLFNLEEIAVRTCAAHGVKAWRREGKSGAWTEAGKIAAIGFKVQRWVTYHGMSFNVKPALDGFSLIVPCGLAGEPVASLNAIPGAHPAPVDAVAASMANHYEDVFRQTLARYGAGERLPDILRIPLEQAGCAAHLI